MESIKLKSEKEQVSVMSSEERPEFRAYKAKLRKLCKSRKGN